MNIVSTMTPKNSDNEACAPLTARECSRSTVEYQIARDILRLVDEHGAMTRQYLALKLEHHGVCMLRDVLQGMIDMRLIEECVGPGIRRSPMHPRTKELIAPRYTEPARPPVVADFGQCEQFV